LSAAWPRDTQPAVPGLTPQELQIAQVVAERLSIKRGPAVAGGLVYIGSEDGTIHAFSALAPKIKGHVP
jgi:hypothetical protein